MKLSRQSLLVLILAITIHIVTCEEDDSWYDIYRQLMVNWETDDAIDGRVPIPSKFQQDEMKRAQSLNLSEYIITDLNKREQLLLNIVQNEGIPVLRRMANFSRGFDDISVYNFKTTSRIIRYYDRMVENDEFQTSLQYLGISFRALLNLNYEGRLFPEYDPQSGEIDYRMEKYIYLPELLDIIREIDFTTWQLTEKFDDLYSFIPNAACRRSIKRSQENIRKGAGSIYEFVRALNNSRIIQTADGEIGSSFNDPEVRKHLQAVQRECSGNECIDSIRNLLAFIKEQDGGSVATNCNFIDLATQGDRKYPGANRPPCWRDFMITKAGGLLQVVMQGMMVVSFSRTSFVSQKVYYDKYLANDFYTAFRETFAHLKAESAKCLVQNAGEAIMQERTAARMEEFFAKPLDELRLYPYVGAWDTKVQGISNSIKWYVNKYHSDYRWRLHYYKTIPQQIQIQQFSGTYMRFLDYQQSGLNVILYGAPAHEYFYDQFDNEYFHEFCSTEITVNKVSVGFRYIKQYESDEDQSNLGGFT